MPRLVQRLRRALAVEPGEGAVVAWAAAALFLIEWGSVAVSNVSDTLFLKRVGVQYLPVVFLVNSLLLTLSTLAAGRLAVRFDHRRLLTWVFLLLAVVLLVLWLLVLAAAPGIATMLVIASKQIDVIALLMFWTVIAGLMTSRQGKRLVALMTAGGTLGTILGSFTSGPFGRFFGIPDLLAIAAASFCAAALAAIPLAGAAPPRLRRPGAEALPEQQPRLRAFWRESSLFRVLVGTSFLAGVLGPMLYYAFSFAADLATRTADGEQRLLGLYGQLRGWINVGVLAVQIGGSAVLFRRIGVPLAAALAPAAYLLGFAGLGARFGLSTAMPATMGTGVLDHTVYDPAQSILAALLPPRIRTAATSVIQGPVKRAGAALGSLLILAVVAVGDPARIALAALPIAALWMVLALLLWRTYPNLLLEAASVDRGDTDEAGSLVALLDAGTLRTLQRNLESEDIGLCRAACSLFADAPPSLAIEALVGAVAAAPAANRPLLIETLDRVLADAGTTAPEAARLTTNLLRALTASAGLSSLERARLLHLLGRALAGRPVTTAIRALLEQACGDSAEAVRTAARVACLRAGVGDVAPERFDEAVAAALESGDAAARTIAIAELRFELLAGAGDSPLWARRLALLTDRLGAATRRPEPIVPAQGSPAPDGGAGDSRSQAVAALADIVADHPGAASATSQAVLALANDSDPAARAAVLRFIGNAGLAEYAALLTERLSSRSAMEAAAARDALEALGPRAADALLHALRHGGRRAREAIPAMLRDMHADRAVLRARVDREIGSSRELLLVLGVLEASAVSRLVLQRIRERIDESMHVVLELLASILGDDRIARVCNSLGRAWNVRDRAVLLEALEALLPAAERARILPLLEDQSAQRLAVAAAQALGRRFPTLEEALAMALSSRDSLTTALLAATVDRRLLARVAPELDVEAALRLFSPVSRPAATTAEAGTGGEVPASVAPEENAMLTPVEKMLHLRTLDLFEALTTRQLSELAGVVREVTVRGGEIIVAEGEFDDSMYFIVDGAVRIAKGGHPVAELGARDFFGEMAVFDGETRSATAIATGEVRLLRLARNDLFEVMEDQPAIGIGICQTLIRRVRNMLNERSPAR